MRIASLGAVLLVLLTTAVLTQQLPLRQDVEPLSAGPMRTQKVKDGLYVIRGPFLPCGTRGCRRMPQRARPPSPC